MDKKSGSVILFLFFSNVSFFSSELIKHDFTVNCSILWHFPNALHRYSDSIFTSVMFRFSVIFILRIWKI